MNKLILLSRIQITNKRFSTQAGIIYSYCYNYLIFTMIILGLNFIKSEVITRRDTSPGLSTGDYNNNYYYHYFAIKV